MALELYHQNEDGVVVYRTEDNTLQLDIQLAEETSCRFCRGTDGSHRRFRIPSRQDNLW